MIELKKINKFYNKNVHALSDVNLRFDKVGLNFVVGKSGSGKSTLLNIIGCLDDFESGEYYFLNKDISNCGLEELDKLRNYYFGFIFQDFLLIDNMNVLENIEFSLSLQNNTNHEKVFEIMKELDIYDLKDRKITEISGGQRQRVAIARALIKNPSVILADEPTGNLDDASRKNIYDLLKKLSAKYLIIIVSHDLIAAEKYADRIIKLEEGKIVEDKINNFVAYYVKDNINNAVLASRVNKYDLLDIIENANSPCSLSFEKKMVEKKGLKDVELTKVNKIDKLPNEFVFKCIKSSVSNNKFKYLLSTVFYSLTFFLLMVLVSLTNYKTDVVVTNYINKYNLNSFCLYKSVTYTDAFDSSHFVYLYNGYLLKEELQEEFNNVHDVAKASIKNGDKYGETNCYFIEDNVYDLKENEIVITDYLSSIYNVNKGDAIALYGNVLTIKDVVKTDFETYGFGIDSSDENERLYANQKTKFEYNICYVSNNFKNQVINVENGISLPASNFYYSNKYDIYYENSLVYNSALKADNSKLLYGRMPSNDNEILVSSLYADSIVASGSIESLVDKAFKYKDLSTDGYNGYFSNIINLYGYFNDGVKIAGIIDSDDIDVFVSKDIYNCIVNDYKDFVFADYFVASDFKTKNIEGLFNKNIYFDEINIRRIISSGEVLKGINFYLLAILVIFIIIALFMILNYTLNQIDKSKKQIGIMKALGVRNKDIMKIFVWEIMILTIVTIFASFIMYCTTLLIAYAKSVCDIIEKPFNFLYFDFTSVGLVILAIILAFFLGSVIPIKKLSSKKPMVVIRGG